jgi:hypothetical protein
MNRNKKFPGAWLFLASGLQVFAGSNLLSNADFAQGAAHWRPANTDSPYFEGGVADLEGGPALHLIYRSPGEVTFSKFEQTLPLENPDGIYELSADIKCMSSDGGVGPYIAVNYLNKAGKRLAFGNAPYLEPDGEWHAASVRLQPPAGTVRVDICLILHGHGEAFFRNAIWRELSLNEQVQDGTEVTLSVAPAAHELPLFGVGAEDDGWAHTKGNRSHGWTDEDLAVCEQQIRWLEPDFLRMFIWIGEWMPFGYFSDPAKKDAPFNWDTDLLQSKYKMLSLYKELGTEIEITCVEWNIERFGHMWGQPQRTLEAYADLMEHLIKEKGFDNIRYFTLSNEPNISFAAQGGSFELYVWFCKNLQKEFDARGLNLSVVGGDDGNNFAWFKRCVTNPELFESAAVFASHQYPRFPKWNPQHKTDFFRERTELMDSMPVRKPMIMAEFGFAGRDVSSINNPYMKEYDYAIQLMDYMLEGFEFGVSGFNVWTMYEMYYAPYTGNKVHGNKLMTYGLWDYEGNRLRPAFYATALLTRNTEPGEPVINCISSDPALVRSVVIGDKLFFVNKSIRPVEASVEGAELSTGGYFDRAVTDSRILREGAALEMKAGKAVLPPESFGYIQLSAEDQ